MNFSIYYPEKSIAVTRYGFKIENTWITKMGNTITAQVTWTAPLNNGYFLFKSPSYHRWDKNRVVFQNFNLEHRSAKFYLGFAFWPENKSEHDKMEMIGRTVVAMIFEGWPKLWKEND